MATDKQQQKINKLLLIYGNKINSYIEQNNYKFSQEYFIECVVAADPDSQGKSVKWVLNNVLNGNILWEDVESGDESKVYDTLNRFYSMRNQFKDTKLKDINQFKRLGDIAEQLRGFEVIQSNKEIKKDKKEQIYKDTIFLYNQNGYLVVVPKTEEASCFWGLGTEWCTAATRSENMFNNYNEDEPLYICITPDNKKYQFHIYSEPMDENDNPIDNITDPVLRELALITGKIKNIKEINYQSERECLEAVKQDGNSIEYIHRNSVSPEQYEEYCLEACKQDSLIINHIPHDISNYEECCLEACKHNGSSIEHIPRDISNYNKCCLEACKSYGHSIKYINHDNLSSEQYENYCIKAVKQNGETIEHIPRDISNYEECCLESCKQNGLSIKHIPRDISNYTECCLESCKQNGLSIKHIYYNISNYYECCLEACKQNGHVLKDIIFNNFSFEQYGQCYLEACKQNGYCLRYINKYLISKEKYEECCLETCKQNGNYIHSIPKDISNYDECLKISKEFKEKIKEQKEEVIVPDWIENDVLKNKEFFNELVISQVEKKVELLI